MVTTTSFTLHIKYSRTTLFLLVQPTDKLGDVLVRTLEALGTAGREPPADLADTTFEELAKDRAAALNRVAFFRGSVGSTDDQTLVFQPLGDGKGQESISGLGFKESVGKEETDVLYMGFKADGAAKISQPVVELPNLIEDEEDEGEEGGEEDVEM